MLLKKLFIDDDNVGSQSPVKDLLKLVVSTQKKLVDFVSSLFDRTCLTINSLDAFRPVFEPFCQFVGSNIFKKIDSFLDNIYQRISVSMTSESLKAAKTPPKPAIKSALTTDERQQQSVPKCSGWKCLFWL